MVEVVGRFILFKHRSKVLGLMSSGTSYGVFINGLIVPYFISHHHWSNIWMAVGSGTLMMTILSVLTLSRSGVFSTSRLSFGASAGQGGFISGMKKDDINLTKVIIWETLFLNGLSCIPFQTYFAPYIRIDVSCRLGGWSKSVFGTFMWIYVSIALIAMLTIAMSCLLPNEKTTHPIAEP